MYTSIFVNYKKETLNDAKKATWALSLSLTCSLLYVAHFSCIYSPDGLYSTMSVSPVNVNVYFKTKLDGFHSRTIDVS